MSNNQHIGLDAEEVIKGRPLQPISKVVVICGEDEDGTQIVREAGDDTGRTLEVNIPILSGSASTAQAVADAILAKASGYIYQPFESSNAVINPRAELGDAVFVGDVYSVLASRSLTFDVISPSDISAPAEAVVDHEFPYGKSPNRTVNRRLAQAESSIRINEGEIALRVKDATGVGTSLTITPNGAAFADEDGNTVLINGGTLKAGTVEADTVVAGISISSPTIIGGDIFGGKFWNDDGECFITMRHSPNDDLTRLLLCTEQHDENNPFFEINAVDPASSSAAKEAQMKVLGDVFLRAIYQSSSNPNVIVTANTLSIIGDVLLSDSYGSSLPSSGSEGQIFFVVS